MGVKDTDSFVGCWIDNRLLQLIVDSTECPYHECMAKRKEPCKPVDDGPSEDPDTLCHGIRARNFLEDIAIALDDPKYLEGVRKSRK